MSAGRMSFSEGKFVLTLYEKTIPFHIWLSAVTEEESNVEMS